MAGRVAAQPHPQARPTVGIALGGGSARGLAHVGVLEWLHEHRIPIDVIAGTSMGGLVGGAYATGMDPDALRALLRDVDWDLMFLGEPPYRLREFRRKQDRRDYPAGIEAGLKNGFQLPSGLDPAHQVGLFLSYIAFPYTESLNFDDLPTPFRAVATDMGAAEVLVLNQGSLAQSLLATMAIPGVFPAVELEGRILGDGGMLNNVPADIVRAMGADIVIAVDVGAPDEEGAIDALSQAGRAIDVMMRSATRASLREADLVIRPDLDGLGSFDWRRSDELADRGYAAAEAVRDQLTPYAIDEAAWEAWHDARRSRVRDKTYVPTFLDVQGTTASLETLIRERLAPLLDQPLDFEVLDENLTWVTGSDLFDRVRYEATTRGSQTGLRIVARQKSNGPPFLRFGVDLSTEALDLAFGFKTRLIALDAGKPNAEVRADLAVGSRLGAGLEYYWPFAGTNLFLAPRALAFRETRNVFSEDELVASVRDQASAIGADLGFTTSHSVELRLGYQIGNVSSNLAIGSLPGQSEREISGAESLARARFTIDRMDAPIVPSRGYRVEAAVDYLFDAPTTATGDFGLVRASVSGFHPLSPEARIFGEFEVASSFSHDAPFQYMPTLGGPFRLSSFDSERFRGQHVLRVTGGYLREIWRLPDFVGGPIYATGFFETGSAYDRPEDAEWHVSGSGGIIMETIVGPLLIAGAFGDESSAKFYFLLGDIFP